MDDIVHIALEAIGTMLPGKPVRFPNGWEARSNRGVLSIQWNSTERVMELELVPDNLLYDAYERALGLGDPAFFDKVKDFIDA